MDTTDVAVYTKPEKFDSTIVTFVVSDPQVLVALSEYRDRPGAQLPADRTKGRCAVAEGGAWNVRWRHTAT